MTPLDSWEPIFALIAAFGGTCAYLVWVASSVNRWRKTEQARNVTVDVINADIASRGLTAQGALDEAAHYRDTVDNHDSAIADTKRRVDGIEVRVEAAEVAGVRRQEALVAVNERVDDLDTTVRTIARREED